jgi:hypothetical protein
MTRRLALAMGITMAASPQSYKVGDRIEPYDSGWLPGTIVELGSGNYSGYFLVKYDQFSTQRYFKPSDLRPLSKAVDDKLKNTPPPAVYKAGDRVDAYEFGWQPGTVT